MEDRLRHANPAVIFAAIKVFLKYTENFPSIARSVLRTSHSDRYPSHRS
jgi:hypothetical protein